MNAYNTSKGALELRELGSIAEMIAAEKIQKLVWGEDTITHPKELLIPIQHEGGLAAGAFNADRELVGFIFGFPTRDPTVLHSQLLATLEEWRGLGIGTALKWFQRQWCLERGIQEVRWTVDPLRSANAEVNIRHLGGVAATYYPDYYGVMQGIDAGVASDRLLVEWHLSSQRVIPRINQPPQDRGFEDAQAAIEVENGVPCKLRFDLSCRRILVQIPGDFVSLAKTNTGQALQWRDQTRQLFQNYFSKGYWITEFTRINYPAYLLEMRD